MIVPIQILPSFLFYCYVSGITPGPANLCSLSAAMQFGRRNALKQWIGLFTGFFINAMAAVFIAFFLRNDFEQLCEIAGIHRRGIFGFPRDKNAQANVFGGKRGAKNSRLFYGAFGESDQRKSDFVLHQRAHFFCPAVQPQFRRGFPCGNVSAADGTYVQFGLAFCGRIPAANFYGTYESCEQRDGNFVANVRCKHCADLLSAES